MDSKKVIVIGMGQGGMTAAIKLSKLGFDVSVYEKAKKGEVSYSWYDDIRLDIFSLCGLENPDESIYCQKSKWLFVSPNEEGEIPVPPAPPMEEVSISRRGLIDYFVSQLDESQVHFESPVESLIVEDDIVKGIIVNGEKVYADLVIDASGVNSPFRREVPKKFGIQEETKKGDILKGYRAFYKRKEGSLEPKIHSTMYVKHLDSVGISWCNLNEDNEVDVLIGRIDSLPQEEVDRALDALYKKHEILSKEEISSKYVDICLRSQMPLFVADGYIALGDSAFMPMPLMGSGIESSLKAASLFVSLIENEKIQDFSAKEMWKFEVEYMHQTGASFTFIDIVKRWALHLDPKIINWIFCGGLIEESDLALVSTDENVKAKLSFKSIMKKLWLLLTHLNIVFKLIGALSKGLKGMNKAKHIPKKYNEKKVLKWAKQYDKCIYSMEK